MSEQEFVYPKLIPIEIVLHKKYNIVHLCI